MRCFYRKRPTCTLGTLRRLAGRDLYRAMAIVTRQLVYLFAFGFKRRELRSCWDMEFIRKTYNNSRLHNYTDATYVNICI